MALFVMEALPNELLARIIIFLDRRSLAQVRLVNKRLNQISVKLLFAKIALYAHWTKRKSPPETGMSREYYNRLFRLSDEEAEPLANENCDTASSQPVEAEEGPPFISSTRSPRRRQRRRQRLQSRQSSANNEEIDFSFVDGHDPPNDDESAEYDPSWRTPGKRSPSPNPTPPWALDGSSGSSYNSQKFKNILENSALRELVKEVQIYTCNSDCDLHPMYADKWYGDDNQYRPEFDAIYLECIQRIVEFPNIYSIAVHFDRHSSGNNRLIAKDLLQNSDCKSRWLHRILCQIDARKITQLGVRHYDNTAEIQNSLYLLIKRAINLTSLRLHIVHEQMYQNTGCTLKDGNIHAFWSKFPGQLLQPKQQNLTTLVLYSDMPLGWFPRLDLRKIHFAQLRSLTLGQHIFYDDHQVNWIISHSTLEELNLDHCAILYCIGPLRPDWLDKDGYPKVDPRPYIEDSSSWAESLPNLRFVPIPLRWHDMFSRFQALHALQEFRFGSSKQWNFRTLNRHFRQNEGVGHPVMPWDDEKNIENKILRSRYLLYDDFKVVYRFEWLRQKWLEQFRFSHGSSVDDLWLEALSDGFERYPDCKDADEAALQALLSKIKGR